MPNSDDGGHAQLVDEWLERGGKDLAPRDLLRLFEAALGALWTCTSTTLGVVTVTAIVDRVLYKAAEKFPSFSCLKVEPDEGIQCHPLREHLGASQTPELMGGVRFVLVELLTVIGNLTADVLTPDLHAELSKITLRSAVDAAEGERGEPAARINSQADPEASPEDEDRRS